MKTYRKLKAWDDLSPSGKRYRKMLWNKKISESPNVVWEGDVFLPNDDIVINGNLTINGSIVANTIAVFGDLNANSVSAKNVFVDKDIHANDVDTIYGIQVTGDCYVNNIYNAIFVVVKNNLYAKYVNTVHTEVSKGAFIDLIVSKISFKVEETCDIGTVYSREISCYGSFTADNVYTKIFRVKDSKIFGEDKTFDVRKIPRRPYKES